MIAVSGCDYQAAEMSFNFTFPKGDDGFYECTGCTIGGPPCACTFTSTFNGGDVLAIACLSLFIVAGTVCIAVCAGIVAAEHGDEQYPRLTHLGKSIGGLLPNFRFGEAFKFCHKVVG